MVKQLSSFWKKVTIKLKNYRPAKPLAFLFFFIPIFVAFSRALFLDNDFWFLVNTGKYIVYHGFPTIEPFTIHQNFSFIVQQWLTDVIYYYIHLYLGGWGIVIFTMMQFLLILFICYKLCVLVSENRIHLSIILTSVVGFLLSLLFVRSRPQMFDFIILLSLLYFLELYIRKKEQKYLYFLPLLSLLMINLHASSFFMIFMFMLPYLISSFKFRILCFESDGCPKRVLFIILVVMLFVGVINPYGIKAITYLFTSYGNSYINQLVGEMQCPKINTIFGITVYGTIFLVFLCYIVSKKQIIKIRYFLLLLGTTVLSLSSLKGFSFFIIASIFSLGDYLKDKFRVYDDQFHYSRDFKIKYGLIVIVLFLFLGIYGYYLKSDFYQTSISNSISYLQEIERADPSRVKLYTDYDSGAFAEYKGFKVYIDPRAEIFLKKNNHQKDIMKEYYQLGHGMVDIECFLNNYDFDYLIVNKKDYLYKYYLNTDKNENYKKIYTDTTQFAKYYLYKRV